MLKKASKMTNYTTVLPLGDSDNNFALTTSVRCTDQVGSYTDVTETVGSLQPSSSESTNLATSVIKSVDTSKMASADVVEVSSSLASAASLLNFVVSEGGGNEE